MKSSKVIALAVLAAFFATGGFAYVARSAAPMPADDWSHGKSPDRSQRQATVQPKAHAGSVSDRAGSGRAKTAQRTTATISKAQAAPGAGARAEDGIPSALGQSARPKRNGAPVVRTDRNDIEQLLGAATGTGFPIVDKRGGLPGCFCGIDTEGRSLCFDDLDCPVVTACTSSSGCPSGYRCVADNCCTAPFDFGCFPKCPNTLACSSGSNCAAGYNLCENDLCQDAVPLTVPGFATGNTTTATVDSAPFCDVANLGPGVWYKVIGTGNTITASTCSEFNANPDTKISVYCAGCSTLECAAGNDDNCTSFLSFLSTVSWCSRAGAEYLILVHDFSATSGSGGFTLIIWDDGATCSNPPCAQTCNATVPIDCGAIVNGDTSPNTSAIDAYNCVAWDESGPEIVYEFTPTTDSRVTAALTNLPNDLDVFVLSDRCASNACIAYGDSSATFDATAGTTYFIAVDGFQGIEGTFTLTVTCEPLIPPGACCNGTTGICNDGVDPAACRPPLLFTAGTLCSNLNPPCTVPGCGPTADGLGCEPVTCPTSGDACLSTVVSSTAGWQVRKCACIPDSACHVVMTPDIFPGVSCAGTCGTGNQCNLIGTDTDGDSVNDLFDCQCGPVACGQSAYPTCGGVCPVDTACKADTALNVCDCVPVACNQSNPDTCGGECPVGQECVSALGAAACRCAPIGEACSQCGPGAHFIDACGPFPPVGTDLVANTGAVVGIDLNLDCIRDTSLVLRPCPPPNNLLQVDKTQGPIDDSLNFPGTSPVDGHPAGPGLDVIDTEIVSMCLTNGSVTLIAGAGGPSAIPLQPSLGNVAEDLATPDPTQADSIFNVFFEVSGAGIPGGPLYNQTPLPIKGRIDCLPPAANYLHPAGMCIPLTTLGACIDTGNACVSNRDCPGSSCGGTTVVANLVSANHSVNQPVCGDFGFPECFGNCPAGETCVTGVNSCTCEPIPCGQSNAPACDGQCPQGAVCTADATGGFCTCRPTDCTPTADGTACQNAICSGVQETCAPKCVRFDPQTGATTILDCACGDAAACHVAVAPPVRAGGPCVVPDNGTGTITLPPAGCDYLSPNEVHTIIDGLPAGTTIELSAIHQNFICGDSSSRFCSLQLPPGQCEDNGGSLGGKGDCFESTLALTLNGTGALAGFQRSLSVPVLCEVHTAPRTPGHAVQTFPTEMARLEGQLFGDPDFCTLKVSGGRGFGLPSPGQTTLTRLSSGAFSVDSFFDITYQIDFAGCPGSALDGLSGSTTATIRMQTNSRTLPSCAGSCLAGEICEQSTTLNPDGTYSVCCNCIPEPRVACCLLDSTCRDTPPDVCLELGGNPQRPGTTCAGFECPAVEIDVFESSIGTVELSGPFGTETIAVHGPATAHVYFEGAVEGSANDDDGDGLDEVLTEMVQLNLTGTSTFLGPVQVSLHPTIRSMGEIEETANNTAGTLDLPPFTATGTADSFFDLFFQIDLPDQGIQLFTQSPKRMRSRIAHKPPGPGALYEGLGRIQLYDGQGNPTEYFLESGRHRPNPPVEVDVFPFSIGEVELEDTSSGFRDVIAVHGPATAQVYFEGAVEGSADDDDGDGFEEVVTEMTQLELAGSSSLFGPVQIRLHPTIPSMGEIEEMANNTAGTLDVPPFTATGTARSYFDLFFQVDLPELGIRLFTQRPKRMSATIDNKPPGPGALYENLDRIQLYDEAGTPTGYFLVAGHHRPNPPVEIDVFESSIGDVELEDTSSGFREVIAVNGPATAHVFFEGAVDGSANDDDGDSFDEVVTEMVQLELTGTSSLFGPVAIHLHPTIRSMGEIEETANNTAGTLDLPPFTPTGTARSFFDLFFQVDLPELGIQLFTRDPKRMSSTIAHKPPGPGAVYENLDRIQLYDAAGNPTPYFLVAGHHRPNPGIPCEQSDPPVCGGFCQTGQVCASVPGAAACRCRPIECPPGEVIFMLPPDGFTDPAQPHPIYEPGVRQGIKTFLVQAPVGADILGCWSLCETDAGGTNSIVDIALPVSRTEPTGITRQYLITLDHPLQPGAITTLTYKGATTGTATGVFKALPGDAGADGKTDSGDLKALIDCLNSGSCRPPECDIDRQGRCTGADIEREIDLLNGGGSYDVWDQAMLASDCVCPGGCPPTR